MGSICEEIFCEGLYCTRSNTTGFEFGFEKAGMACKRGDTYSYKLNKSMALLTRNGWMRLPVESRFGLPG